MFQVSLWLSLVSAGAAADPAAFAPTDLGAVSAEQTAPEDPQLRFLGYLITRTELTNISSESTYLQGQVIGRLFGPNETVTKTQLAFLTEQAFLPFFILEPRVLDGLARLRASFQIRCTWGDSQYGSGGNSGCGIGANQVNLQTQNLEAELNLPAAGWTVNVGLQRAFDNVRDPYRTFPTTLAFTGERLTVWAANAAGVSVNGRLPADTFRFGVYQLFENRVALDDHVTLFEALGQHYLGRGWNVGAQLRYLRDGSGQFPDRGGISVLGQGPDSDLADFNGTYRFPLGGANYTADLYWVGLDTDFNPELTAGRWGGSAFVLANLGAIHLIQPQAFGSTVSIRGVMANLRGAWRYGMTRNDAITAEFIYASGDSNGITDGVYTGVITGNQYAAPGAVFISSGAYLLFNHASVVSRFYSAVADLSNMGFGTSAATLNLSHDFIPNALMGKVGAAIGGSNVTPKGGGALIGVEVNAMVSYRIAAQLSIEAHAAYLHLGNFYSSPDTVYRGQVFGFTPPPPGRPQDPWTTFIALKWLVF